MNEEQQKVSHIDYSSVPEGKLKESETPKPSKDMMDMIREHTDKTYNLAVSHCINIVQDVMAMPHNATDNFAFYQKVIKELNNLKYTPTP